VWSASCDPPSRLHHYAHATSEKKKHPVKRSMLRL
jgi:hypothetical protein